MLSTIGNISEGDTDALLDEASSVGMQIDLAGETVMATTLLATEAVAQRIILTEVIAVWQQLQQSGDHNYQGEQLEQPLVDILTRHAVRTTPDNVGESIAALDGLVEALYACSLPNAGRAPGFFTKTNQSHRQWSPHGSLPYETLTLPCSQIPLPSPADSIRCFQKIRSVWSVRQQWHEAAEGDKQKFCQCIREYDHITSNPNVLMDLARQVLEQEMIEEASDSITTLLTRPGFSKGDLWDRNYTRELLPSPEHLQYTVCPVRFLRNRDDYIGTFCKLAMSAKQSIKLCTSYVFARDPGHRYILLDLLPSLARRRNIKVHILFDLITIESSVLQSVFHDARPPCQPDTSAISVAAITGTSFIHALTSDCPPFANGLTKPASGLSFLQQLFEISSVLPTMEIKFWCARDATSHYRIKNHAKCAVFDCDAALVGGSNIAPTVRAAKSECDLLVTGQAARHVDETFMLLWEGMRTFSSSSSSNTVGTSRNASVNENVTNDDDLNITHSSLAQDWDDENCRVALVRSHPGSDGEDAILRAVLGAISEAKTSVTVSMGHCAVSMPFVHAVSDACDRGVHVRMLVNSMYSSDLRTGQADLFHSLRELLRVAPQVQVWATVMATDVQPDFLHSKYVVIDGKWSAVGSWNLWTRSAFYEIEHELLMYSEKVASFLEHKFDRERTEHAVLLNGAENCVSGNGFCPSGCAVCRPFGPFFSS